MKRNLEEREMNAGIILALLIALSFAVTSCITLSQENKMLRELYFKSITVK